MWIYGLRMRTQQLDMSLPALSAAISACERGHLWQEAIQLFHTLHQVGSLGALASLA